MKAYWPPNSDEAYEVPDWVFWLGICALLFASIATM